MASVYDVPPSAPPAQVLPLPEVARIPRDLKGWSEQKLEDLSGPGLSQLCEDRGLAKGGSKADKVARLRKWKKANAPKKDPSKKRARPDASPASVAAAAAAPPKPAKAVAVKLAAAPSPTKVAKPTVTPAVPAPGLSTLTVAALQEICVSHGLTKSGNKEVVVARLKAAVGPTKSFTIEKLKEICRSSKLTVSGTREQLVERLMSNP
jgi:hypothetical protein